MELRLKKCMTEEDQREDETLPKTRTIWTYTGIHETLPMLIYPVKRAGLGFAENLGDLFSQLYIEREK